MKKFFFSLLIVIIVLGLVACENDDNKQLVDSAVTSNIYGQVIFPPIATIMNTDNNMLGYARVILDGEQSVITDYEGKFVFYNVSPGKHVLKVEDEAFKSKEYEITVNKGEDLTGIKLNAELELIRTATRYDYEDDKYSKLFAVLASHPELDSKKVYYLDGKGEYILLEPVDERIYDVTDIFAFGKKYNILVKLFDKDNKLIKEFKNEVKFEELNLYKPANEDIVTGTPEFKWEELDGIIEYDIYIYYYSEYWEDWDYVYLENNYNLVKSQYTLQLESGEQLEDGYYMWEVEANRYSNTGLFISSITKRGFFWYSEN